MEPARCKRYGDGVGYLVCCACAGSSAASSTDIPIEGCLDKSGGVTVDMLECIGLEAERQDKQLNRNYKALMGDLSEARKKQLQAASGKRQAAQRLWTQYRDANCNFCADPEGGSTATATSADCVLQSCLMNS